MTTQYRITAWVVIFVDRNGVTTEHSLHMTEDDALRAATYLARCKWDEYQIDTPFPADATDARTIMDALMDAYPPMVRLEVAEISVSGDVARSLSVAYAAALSSAKHAERVRQNR